MDKNTIIGFALIAAIVIGFGVLTRPSAKELARQQKYKDSIMLVQQKEQAEQLTQDSLKNATAATDSLKMKNDTVGNAVKADEFGGFSASASGEEKFITLENKLLKLTFSTKGGRIYTAELKNYKTHDKKPLILFDKDESSFGFTLTTENNRVVNTSALYFEPVDGIKSDSQGNQTLTLRLKTNVQDAYMDFVYILPVNDYMLKYDIKSFNMSKIMPAATNLLEMSWKSMIRQQEKSHQFEERYSGLNYRFVADDMEKLNVAKNESKEIGNKIKWIAFKDQYFSSVLIADDAFSGATLKSEIKDKNSDYLKSLQSDMSVNFDITGKTPTGFHFFFGPNQYKVLSAYDKGVPKENKLYLRDLISLGWGIFGWVNRYFVIPMFNFFSKYIGSMGLIILLMTIVVKLIIFPMTYKSYMSSAKMRVLKPEIDEINARIPSDKAMERQKATMDLYKKVGVSPMSGCLPMLLQMPILLAMFSFFPAAIELRQQSFLWAKDLSAYDAILTWKANIPLISGIFGNHLSLFAVLMTIASIFSTKILTPATTDPNQPGAGMMKWMMYIMPIMFLFMFNNYASGLTYYYFLSSLFTVLQTFAIRQTIDEKKLLAQLHAKRAANSKNPQKKSGGFMARLEQMQRDQQKMIKQNSKDRSKR